jgi:hypothetical protein
MTRLLAALKSMNRLLLSLLIVWATWAAMLIVSHGHVPLWPVLVVSAAIGFLMPSKPTKDEPEGKEQP